MEIVTAFAWEGRERYISASCNPGKLPQRCWIAHLLWPKQLPQCLGSEGWHRGNLFYLFPKMNFLLGWVHLADHSISWIVLPFIRMEGFYRCSIVHVINFHIFSSLYYLGYIQYLCHLQTALSFNSHFHRHFWRAYSEIFRSFYECEECGGEPQDSPTYSSPFQLPAACQILINRKVARSYSCWFPLFLSGEFLSSMQSTEPALSPF